MTTTNRQCSQWASRVSWPSLISSAIVGSCTGIRPEPSPVCNALCSYFVLTGYRSQEAVRSPIKRLNLTTTSSGFSGISERGWLVHITTGKRSATPLVISDQLHHADVGLLTLKARLKFCRVPFSKWRIVLLLPTNFANLAIRPASHTPDAVTGEGRRVRLRSLSSFQRLFQPGPCSTIQCYQPVMTPLRTHRV